ncbi:MAG: hypothetical protein JW973_14965 [Bacteroidales bacterium]|nr:hypothetical protein [Bacteroidales bacterium]
MEQKYYKWTNKDKWLYIISLIPFIMLFAGTLYILIDYSVLISLLWIFLYIIVNFFQAGCCVGCPYRGRYCPAFCGVYLGNLLSCVLYKNREFDAEFFERNAAGGEITLILFLIFPLYWIFLAQWYYIPIYIGLIIAHIVLFMPSQCSRCSHNKNCPGGKAYQAYCKLIKKSHKL